MIGAGSTFRYIGQGESASSELDHNDTKYRGMVDYYFNNICDKYTH